MIIIIIIIGKKIWTLFLFSWIPGKEPGAAVTSHVRPANINLLLVVIDFFLQSEIWSASVL